MLADARASGDACSDATSYRFSLGLIMSMILVDIVSLGMAVSLLPQIGSNCGQLSDFDWICAVGLVGSALSSISIWARYAPDGCTRVQLPLHFGLLLVMGVFSINVGIYGHAVANFDTLRQSNGCVHNADAMGVLIFAMLIINCYKFFAAILVELLIGQRHVWCCSVQSASPVYPLSPPARAPLNAH